MKIKLTKAIFNFSIIYIISFLISCGSTKKASTDFLYFQEKSDSSLTINFKERVTQIGDLLSIQIISNSLNQEQTLLFNLPNNANNINAGYMIDASGNIELPIIGSIKAVSLTKDQLQTLVANKIESYIKEPVVLIKFNDFRVNVLGEVRLPGIQNFQRDKVTVIDALSSAGDLTDYGKREDVTIIRDESGSRKFYKIDLRTGTMFQSPGFQLQPNDIVYVGANDRKLKNLRSNPNQKGLQLLVGLSSLASAIILLIVNIK